MSLVLYLTRNGLLEPLGQSQIFPYLCGLSRHYRFTLISFEKPADISGYSLRSRTREQCTELGLRWISLRFRLKPRPLAPALAIPHLTLVALWQWSRRSSPSLFTPVLCLQPRLLLADSSAFRSSLTCGPSGLRS